MANLDELRRVLLEMASPNTLRDGVVTLLDDVRGLVASRERHRDTQVVHHARIDQLASVSSESCQRIDNLATLSTDVCRRLVDTRGEQSLHRLALDEHGERLTTLADQLAGLQRLVESLVNERGEGRRPCCAGEPHTCDQEAIAAAEGRTDRAIVEISHLRAEVERLTRERDEAKTAAQQWEAIATGPHGTARQIVEAIATWLTDDVIAIDSNVRRIIADGIRAGEWKP